MAKVSPLLHPDRFSALIAMSVLMIGVVSK